LAGGIDGPPHQFACFVKCTKLGTDHGQSAKGAEMSGLFGENPSIGLFGRVQCVSAGNGHCRSNARPVGKS
jgi:hypothetical protein